jgi:hypothetical protein
MSLYGGIECRKHKIIDVPIIAPIDGVGQFNKTIARIDDLDQFGTKQFSLSMLVCWLLRKDKCEVA